MHDIQSDVAAILKIAAITNILDVVCQTTGMGFAAIARVTESQWVCCSVRDNINFGLTPGGELKIETTFCNEIRQSRQPIVINHVSEDECYREHHVPAMYGFESYISMPIILSDGTFFGTLCAIDPRPAQVNKPEVVNMFKLFAELVAFHLDAQNRISASEARLVEERKGSDLREQFIAVLGHDLRNPLGAISSGAYLLQRMALPGRGNEIASMIRECTSRMVGLIDNILDFARGRLGGGVAIVCTSEPLEPVLTHVVNELRAIWPTRTVDLHMEITESVYCDHGRISQLLSNLLGNALNYGDPTQPIRVDATTRNNIFELSVVNGGKPIPADKQARLFQPFARGEAGSDKSGLGLGLFIASEIAQAHEGSLSVASDERETRFTLRIPTNAAAFKDAA